ncbi:MAG: carbon storage regulator [Pirellulaceae bacterium]
MLVLTRKPQQSVRIGEHITLSIVRVRGNTVQLGIEAPKDVNILRSELVEKPKKEQPVQQLDEVDPAIESSSQAQGDEPKKSTDGENVQRSNFALQIRSFLPNGERDMCRPDHELKGRGMPEDILLDTEYFDSPLQQFIFAP